MGKGGAGGKRSGAKAKSADVDDDALLDAAIAALAVVEPVYVRKSDAEINYPDGFPDAAARPPKLNS